MYKCQPLSKLKRHIRTWFVVFPIWKCQKYLIRVLTWHSSRDSHSLRQGKTFPITSREKGENIPFFLNSIFTPSTSSWISMRQKFMENFFHSLFFSCLIQIVDGKKIFSNFYEKLPMSLLHSEFFPIFFLNILFSATRVKKIQFHSLQKCERNNWGLKGMAREREGFYLRNKFYLLAHKSPN